MDKGWIELSIRPIPTGEGPVIVWHAYSGAMVEDRIRAANNRFMTHWREIDQSAWISAAARKPTRQDADAYQCVIAQNLFGEITTAGWHRFAHEADLVYWQRPPDPPCAERKTESQSGR